ncbi:hypothetical protein FZC35_02290 [Candidatus Cytomitobacter indipagum]|uniref:Uncharacterized protein n=1 Tax=Candidatus Cytomitobacter indipagum TaxID=2601575 RepID=A0A5C0UDV2_9PROT|nr:YqgE/AlgH family protein [Candidatus Cytomitobacter indipagum]QEK38188.1 hypothetical protein FZC35_02290 [Candidatus Cytomitobacter indipagum]
MYNFHNFRDHKMQKGEFLASSPFISNKLLYNTVIMILECNESIVSAIKINQHKLNRDEHYAYPICDEGKISGQKKMFFLHDEDERLKNSEKLAENIFVTSTEQKMQFYPKKYYAVHGCMNFIYSEFIEDIKNGEWVNVHGSSKLVFDTPVVKRWHDAYKTCGIRPEMIQRGCAYC